MILIIDDDSAVRSSLSFMLKRAGYEAQTVPGPREAMEVVRSVAPDLILMDIKMPRMGGLEATRIIRSYSKEIPVIALTAYAFEADKDFVTKPVSKAALEEALGKCSG